MLFRHVRKPGDPGASGVAANPTPNGQEPGWEYVLLAHALREEIEGSRVASDAVPSQALKLTNVKEAAKNVSTKAKEITVTISRIDDLLSPRSIESALGAPGESGNAEAIRALARKLADVYREMIAWQHNVLATEVPLAARHLYEAFADDATLPIQQMHESAVVLERYVDRTVADLRAGHPSPKPLVVRLTLTVDPALLTEYETGLDKIVNAGQSSTTPGPEGVAPRSRRPSARLTETAIVPALELARGTELAAGEFCAIDFETATRDRSSACSVGVATVSRGRVQEVKRWMIRPPDNRYEDVNIGIHGITPERTVDSPEFSEVWAEIRTHVGFLPLVAHNAAFDMSVIREALKAAGEAQSEFTFFCTYVLARHAWPERDSYRLNSRAEACGVNLDHHEAGSDAEAAALLAVAVCGVAGSWLPPRGERRARHPSRPAQQRRLDALRLA